MNTSSLGDTAMPSAPELRIMLFGKSDDKKTLVGKMISGKKTFGPKVLPGKQPYSGDWGGKRVTVVKTPDIFSQTTEKVLEEMKTCVSLCLPGPNVLLLLVKPSEFTEKNRETLKFILSLFSKDAFEHAMVILTHNEKCPSEVERLIQSCKGRQYSIRSDAEKHSEREMMEKIEKIVTDNRGAFLTLAHDAQSKTTCNLVLFGRRGEEKTLAAKAILGQTDLCSSSNQSECVRKQGEVCGRWVSVVELPALDGKAQQEVMEESFRCISLCDPEGVHAFILVLPVGPLTDEDKGELQTIQDTFSSRVNDFIIILFIGKSDSKAKDFKSVKENKEIQDLIQSCGGRYFVLNIKDKKKVPELIDMVEKMRDSKRNTNFYSFLTFSNALMEKVLKLETYKPSSEECSSDCLRIVLIGKTGCGKSSTGNTILGRKEFEAKLTQTSVTKHCQKAHCEWNGRRIVVVDTPGLFDSNLTNEEVQDEMFNCVNLVAPGPHVFLQVVRIGAKFTKEEKQTLELIKKTFGKGSKKFTCVLLTGGDQLEDQSVEEFIDEGEESFKKLINDCGGRYHVFNNKDKENRTQVSELIEKIDSMVKENGGSCFTNEMLQEAEAAIKKEMQRILKEKEEQMQKEKEELEKKYQEKLEELEKRVEQERAEKEREREQKAKELQEMEDEIRKEKELKEKMEEEIREGRRKEEEERKNLQKELEKLDREIQSQRDEKQTVDKELEESREALKKKQEDWEKERRQLREKQREYEEEQKKIKELEEKYNQEKEKFEKQKEKEEQIIVEQEKFRLLMKTSHEDELNNLKSRYEEEARKKAEEFNEFKKKCKKEAEDQKKEHEKQMNVLVEKVIKNPKNMKEIKDLLKKHKQKLKNRPYAEELEQQQEQEVRELIQEILKREMNDASSCSIL